MSNDPAFNYEDLYYIKTRSDTDKRAKETWGGYSQDYDEAEYVYSHEQVVEDSETNWGVCGIHNRNHVSTAVLVFDLDIHKAPDDFDSDTISVPDDTMIVRSQNGGIHVYFIVHAERGEGAESDFVMTEDLGWDIDIRGSYVNHHVCAPADIPGIGGRYEIVNDERILTVTDPADAAERIQYEGEPLLEYDTNTGIGDFDYERDVEAPDEMPTCYHAGLQLRKAAPDDHPNTHKVNTLTALCGLAAGYSVDEMVEHFCHAYAPGPDADKRETRYQLEHMAGKMDRGSLAPPSISSLRDWGILAADETCKCDIDYHGRTRESSKPMHEDDGSEIVENDETGEQRELPKPTHVDGLALRNGGYGEWKARKDDDGEYEKYFDPSTNFQIEVRSYLYLHGGTYINLTVWPREGEEYHLTGVDPTVFNEKRDFKAHICSGLTTTFSGGEDELNKIKRFVGTQDAPGRTGTHHMGLHGDEWVTPKGVLTAKGWEDKPETVYVDRDVGVERKWVLDPEDGDEFDPDEVASILELLPQTRDPERLIPALMWFYAAPLRPLIHDWTGQFNLLFVLGETGSGKTTTLETLWQAFGMGGEPLTADDTTFTLLTTLGASNGVPMWFDEYKPSDMSDYEVGRFWNEVRKTTRGGVSQRGNADKTTTEYHLHAPTVISGEERVAGSAEERRGIFTTFRKDTTDEHSQTVKRYAQLVGSDYEREDGTIERFDGYNLSAHALAYYQHVLGLDREELRTIWRDCAEYVAELLADENVSGLEDLVKQGLQTIKFGSMLYRHFADGVGADEMISTDEIDNAILYVATRSQGGANRKSHLDSFFELFARASYHEYLREDEHYTFVKPGAADEELRLNLATGYDMIARYARDHDVAEDLLNSKDDYRERIKDAVEDDDSYIVQYSQNSPPIGRAVGIHMQRAMTTLDDFERSMFSDLDGFAEDGDLAEIATPIQALDGSGNPFHAVTVEALTMDEPERGLVYSGTFRDRTGVVELVDWTGCQVCDQIEEGEAYLIKDIKVSYDKEGAVQLEPMQNTTTVAKIQEGVGHLGHTTVDDDQEQLGAATDGGGEVVGVQAKILEELREEPKEIVGVGAIAGRLDESPEEIQDALDHLVTKGRVISHEDGYSFD